MELLLFIFENPYFFNENFGIIYGFFMNCLLFRPRTIETCLEEYCEEFWYIIFKRLAFLYENVVELKQFFFLEFMVSFMVNSWWIRYFLGEIREEIHGKTLLGKFKKIFIFAIFFIKILLVYPLYEHFLLQVCICIDRFLLIDYLFGLFWDIRAMFGWSLDVFRWRATRASF